MLEEEQEFTRKRGGEGISGRSSSMCQDPAVVLGTSPQTGRGTTMREKLKVYPCLGCWSLKEAEKTQTGTDPGSPGSLPG